MDKKYDTYILELIRSNGIPHNYNAHNNGNDIENKFLMFDYFDILYFKELREEEKKYSYYFSVFDSVEDDEQRKASQKTLSLYQHADSGAQSRINPFEVMGGEYLSDRPFLGVIQICLCREVFAEGGDETLLNGEVDQFLHGIEEKISNITDEVLGEERRSRVIKKLYRSSTTGDFCLALRTDHIADIYRVSSRLNDSRNDKNTGLKMMTYTNVGVECAINSPKGEYSTFSATFLKTHPDNLIALRLTADSSILNMLEECVDDLKLEKGLFGRYDYLLHISVEEFAKLYPSLCIKKFGPLCEQGGTQDTGGLAKLIQHPRVGYINERILADVPKANTKERTDVTPPGKKEKENKSDESGKKAGYNDDLLKKISNIQNYREHFSKESFAFQELYRSTRELYKAFSSIFMEKDAEINWQIWYDDMDIMCECIESEMTEYEGFTNEEVKRQFRINLLENWRESIQAINRYTRLVQNVNYQTYQSPVYEIQTQIDAEKSMVAYREAMRMYIQNFVENAESSEGQMGQIEPIVYPELRKSKVEVVALFANMGGNKIPEKRAIICTVPSFEYFGRMYDLMPWLMHEASHYFRVLDRRKRNRFVVEYVCKHVFRFVAGEIVREFSRMISCTGTERYKVLGHAGRNLLSALSEVAVKELEEDMEKDNTDLPLEQMLDLTSCYLIELFSYEANGEKEFETVRESMFNVLWEELRIMGMIENEDKDKLLDNLSALRTGRKNETLAQGLTGYVLECARKRIEALLPDIDDYEWITVEDLILPEARLGRRLCGIFEKAKGKEEYKKIKPYFREYTFMTKRLYRNLRCYLNTSEECGVSETRIRGFLEKVFDVYKSKLESIEREQKEIREFLYDTEEMYFLNNIGMLSEGNKVFCDQLMGTFSRLDNKQPNANKQFRTSIYREACADLMMAVSLQMTGFGYCRQVLQTMSDTMLHSHENKYDNIDNNRFRIVAAVLVEDPKKGTEKTEYSEEEYKIDARELIEQGKLYCCNMLRCIQDIVESDIRKQSYSEKKKNRTIETLKDFIGDIYAQISVLLGKITKEAYKRTLLYIFLNGEPDKLDEQTAKKWREYRDIVKPEVRNKHHFWRLEYFCLGLQNIVTDGYIIVEKDFFDHMKDILKKITAVNGSGCKWEQNLWESLREAKREIGDFYNTPATIYTKTPEQKLEGTIDFIQNFYYYNRFRVAREGGNADGGNAGSKR